MAPAASERQRWPVFAIAGGLGAMLLAMTVPRGLRAISFLNRVAGRPSPKLVGTFDVREIEVREEMIPAPGRALRARLYLPKGRRPNAQLVVIHGLHPQGIEDPRFLAFVTGAARAGFAVVAPDFPEMRAFRIETSSVQGAAAALRWALQHPHWGPRVGALGISYGAGPMFLAADEPEVRDQIAFLVSLGGYFDLETTLAFGLTGDFEEKGRREHLTPHPWARLIFALNHADLLVPPEDREGFAASLRLKLDLDDAGADAAARRLSGDAAKLYAALNGPVSPDLTSLLERSRARLETETRALSPGPALKSTRARVFLLHGFGDDVVPRSETERIQAALAAAGHPARVCLVTTVFSHVTPQDATLAEKFALWRFAYLLLAEAD